MALMASSPPGDRERGLRERDRRRPREPRARAAPRRPARAAAARATASATGTATGGGAAAPGGAAARGGALVPLDLGAEGARRALGVREAVIDGCRRGRDGARGLAQQPPDLGVARAARREQPHAVVERLRDRRGRGAGSPAGVRSRAAWAVSRSRFAFFCFFCFFAFFAFLRCFFSSLSSGMTRSRRTPSLLDSVLVPKKHCCSKQTS